MNLLLDTCVLIDYLGRKEPFFADAERVVAAGFFGDAQLWAAGQSFKDAFYVLNRYIGSERIMDAFLRAFEVIKPVALAPDDFVQAARLRWDDYADCLVALAAQRANAACIVTRDLKGFERSMVPAISPSELLATLEAEQGIVYDAIGLGPEAPIG